MKVKFEAGELRINVCDLLSHLTLDDKRSVVDTIHASCVASYDDGQDGGDGHCSPLSQASCIMCHTVQAHLFVRS